MGQMQLECELRQQYMDTIASSSIDHGVNEALNAIQTLIYSSATLPQHSTIRRISRELAIAESKASLRGNWDQNTQVMTLVDGLWCVSTVVHETLHAVSSIQALEEAIQLMPLFEGLTECLTGYILYKKYQYAFSNCWNTDNLEVWCRIPILYEPNCKRWGAFFHLVPLKTILPLYFEAQPDWTTMCSKFVESVRQSGYNMFRDVLSDVLTSVAPVTDYNFWAECRRSFGKKFGIISGTPLALDFSTM